MFIKKRLKRWFMIQLLQVGKKYTYYVTHDMDKWLELKTQRDKYLEQRFKRRSGGKQMKTEQREVYVTKDEKVFTDKTEAKAHEAKLARRRIFEIRHNPDLNETGRYMSVSYLTVEATSNHRLFAEEYCNQEYGFKVRYIQGHQSSKTAVRPYVLKEVDSYDSSKGVTGLKID